MASSVPVRVQAAASSEKKGRAVRSVQRFGRMREIAKGYPRALFGIGDQQRISGPIRCSRAALAFENEDPGIPGHQLGGVLPVGF